MNVWGHCKACGFADDGHAWRCHKCFRPFGDLRIDEDLPMEARNTWMTDGGFGELMHAWRLQADKAIKWPDLMFAWHDVKTFMDFWTECQRLKLKEE